MEFEKSISMFTGICGKISKLKYEPDKMEEIISEINSLNMSLMKYIPSIRIKEHKCLKCNETNPLMFNRKISECTPCMSKAGYEKIKVKLEKGKERNIIARIARKECTVCKLKVIRENALSFDWDHRNPSEKTQQISKMNCKSDKLFDAEIAKCDIVCRNCHIIKTQYQFDNNLIPKRKCKTVENIIIDDK
jgi:hypothetical protein